ncbi:MAG TPA: hypothetical protein VNN74_08200 [Candidatus Micrarchaeia archaeon]|nr:hypothetical protein [Candidatus Micrarchaeia archaeon]
MPGEPLRQELAARSGCSIQPWPVLRVWSARRRPGTSAGMAETFPPRWAGPSPHRGWSPVARAPTMEKRRSITGVGGLAGGRAEVQGWAMRRARERQGERAVAGAAAASREPG